MVKREGEGPNALTDDDILALKTLKQAITKALSDADTNALFGAPVDTTLLPDYTKIVQNPRDLKSIANDIQSSIGKKGPYSSANEALQDVQLVWDNCFLYNNRPEDASIIDICKRSKLLFQKSLLSCLKANKLRSGYLNVWKGVGQDVRLSQNVADEPEILPMKAIDAFEITSDGGEPIDLLSLGQMRCLDEDAVLSGEMCAAGTSGKNTKKNKKLGKLSGEPVVDWAIDMCEDVWFVWVITKTAWYKLLSPSHRYDSMYQNVALAIDVLQRAVAVLYVDGNPDIKDIVESISEDLKNEGLSDSRRKSSVPVSIKKFVMSYLEAFCGRRKDTYEMSLRKAGVWDTDMEIDAISDEDMPDDFDPEDEILDEEDEDFDRVRKKAWRTVKYKRKKALNDKIQMEKDRKRFEEESKAHRERGEPPAMRKSFRVPKEKVHEVLFLWSFFQEFGDLLQVPPFSFHALEAAFCPGPSVSITIDECSEDMKETREEEPGDEIKETSHMKTEQNEVKSEEIATDVENPEPSENRKEPFVGNDVVCPGGAADAQPAEEEEDPSKDDIPNGTEFAPQETKVEEDEKIEGASHDNNDGHLEEIPVEEEKSAAVQAVPEKRGRGRPRKDGSAPRPRAPGVNKAPQNIIYEPTIKTRRQRGISVPSKHMAEYASMMELDDKVDDDDDYRVVLKRRKSQKLKPHAVQPVVSDDAGLNAIAEALKQTQKMQEEYEASIKEKYGVSSDIIKKGSALDKSYAPSGVLLRDIVLALLGVIDETLPKTNADRKRPSMATATLTTEQKNPWPEEVANNVWSWDGVWKEAKAAALHLAYGDFIDLSVEERIDVVSGLLYEAIESNFLSNEISKRSDNFLQQQAARLALPCEQPHGNDLFLHYRSEIDSIMAPIEDSLSPGDRALTEWEVWKDILGVGTKAFIGEDFGGRRYWALGDGAGAFRVYCQEVDHDSDAAFEPQRDTWGWYEGFRLDELILWLKKADIHLERHLIAALTSAPSPTSSPDGPAKKPSTIELSNWRLDGYKGINQPLLRGEWNLCKGRPTPLSTELRVSQTIESMLGSISFWFKDDEIAKVVYGISDIIMSCNLRDTARALLEADRILIEEKKVTQEWIDVWSPKWRTAVASSIDLKEVPLQVASLQSHVIMQADVIPRGTYLKILDDLNCILTVPIPSDNIVVLKTGLLQHVEKAMQLLNIEVPKAETSDMQAKSDKGISGGVEAPILPLKEESIDLVKNEWTSLKNRIEQLKPVQRYVVRGITYRRHLADLVHVSTEGFSHEEIAIFRRPVAWMYLKPIEYGPKDQLPNSCICAPIVLDPELVDYLVPLSTYINQSRVDWTANDRFKMFVPPRPSQRRSKSTGYWKKGTVVENLCHTHPQNKHDPWESIIVEFDSTAIGETSNISPWKMEIDPDEERRMLQEAHKLEQTVARAQRARSSLRSTDAEEASRQETEWQLEDMRLEEVLTQAQRSEHLLQIYANKTFVEPGQELNTQYHSDEAKQNYRDYLQNLGSEVFAKYAAYAALASNARAKDAHKSAGSGLIPSGPLTPGQQVDPKILQALRTLSRDQFMMLVTNFYIGLKGKYKIPIFAHRELDLFTVWWSVMERSGYERVTQEKQWKDICRSLNLDLSGQTSASYNMRLNYERCLLDFENYLACGQYELDLAQNKAPVHTHAMNPATTRFIIPGAYEHVGKEEASTVLMEAPQPTGCAASKGVDQQPCEQPDTTTQSLKKISLKIATPKSTLIKLKPPAVPGEQKKLPVTEQFSPTEPLGPQITSQGPGAIGLHVSVFWSDEGGWWRAEIVDFDQDTSNHQIVYNKGTQEESFEWVKLSDLGENEIRLA